MKAWILTWSQERENGQCFIFTQGPRLPVAQNKHAAFHEHHKLNFVLLADEQGEVCKKYGSKMAMFNMSNRWTFIIDPQLMIKNISRDIDPIIDSSRVATVIEQLQKGK